MRRVVAYELLSLDGVAEQPDDFITDFDDVMEQNLGRVIAAQDVVLLGRRTYDEWARFWPTSDIEPFAGFINGVQKLVVTSTRPGREWAQTAVAEGDIADVVTELKQQPGGDIGIHGSITLARSLLDAGLVDDLRLVVAPAVRLHGRKLLDGWGPERLSLTRSVTSPTGYLLVDYAVRS